MVLFNGELLDQESTYYVANICLKSPGPVKTRCLLCVREYGAGIKRLSYGEIHVKVCAKKSRIPCDIQ
jgi:hypothetical protein